MRHLAAGRQPLVVDARDAACSQIVVQEEAPQGLPMGEVLCLARLLWARDFKANGASGHCHGFERHLAIEATDAVGEQSIILCCQPPQEQNPSYWAPRAEVDRALPATVLQSSRIDRGSKRGASPDGAHSLR